MTMSNQVWRRRNWSAVAHAATLAVLITCWAVERSEYFALYQKPPSPIMHANYSTFHEMSVRLDEGAPLGNINITRLVRQTSPYQAYDVSVPPNSQYCDFYTLDPGFAHVVRLARHLFVGLPDTFLRTLALQGLFDLFGLFAIYGSFQYLGRAPAVVGAALYATNPVLGYVVTLTFYYFWDGALAVAVLGLLIAGSTHMGRRRDRAVGIGLLITMGVVLGFAAWLRASWVPYAVVLLVALTLFKRTRRAVPLAALAFVVAASPIIVRASRAEGKFATSTRMTWHTAHAALGKFPNVLGLEDDDGYEFELAEHKYGVPYNYCSYRAQDEAMRQNYREVFRNDPGFVVRSVLTRMYLNVFWNANENYFPFWNWWLLGLAIAGAVLMFVQGGHRQVVAFAVLGLFGAACAAIGFVYYINPNYGNVTQLCLIVLACGVPDAMVRLPRAGARANRSRWRSIRPTLALMKRARVVLIVVGVILGTAGVALTRDSVSTYLNTPRPPEQWVAPEPLGPEDVTAILTNYRSLAASDAARFLRYVRMIVPNAPADEEEAIRTFVTARLRLIRGYRTGTATAYRIYLAPAAAESAFQGLARSNRSVLGWRVDTVVGFDVKQPDSWSGQAITLRLDPKASGGADRARVWKLLDEKFVRWGMVKTAAADDVLTYQSKQS